MRDQSLLGPDQSIFKPEPQLHKFIKIIGKINYPLKFEISVKKQLNSQVNTPNIYIHVLSPLQISARVRIVH